MPLQRQLLIGGARWVVFRVNVPVPSPPVHEELRDGWLCFESEVERRRFAPVPAGWDALHDEELIALYHRATTVRGVPDPGRDQPLSE